MITTRYMFFSGKGGVGKTSVACATAIHLAEAGRRVLLVSTDPASNLDDVFETRIHQQATDIFGIESLKVMNLDPEEAARTYREDLLANYRDLLPEDVLRSMEEQLSGACTVEIAAFSLFTHLLTDANLVEEYDHIVFDTAPTGHTLRLLALPKAWSGFLGESTHGTSCIGPLAGLQEQKEQYEQAVAVLVDSAQTSLILVSKPDTFALLEAARASKDLMSLGMDHQQLIVNSILTTNGEDAIAVILQNQQKDALDKMPARLAQLPRLSLPLLPIPPSSLSGLGCLASYLFGSDSLEADYISLPLTLNQVDDGDYIKKSEIPSGLSPIIDELSNHPHSVIMVMGKGGVGKTTIATAIALALAEQGYPVHLSTTDPAAHLSLVLSGAENTIGYNLTTSRIDPSFEVSAYRQEVLATVGAPLNEEALALLNEDLASPCTEEIAVFRAFARIVSKLDNSFVILDTAPTGHTLLLLDNTLAYHRQIEQSSGEIPDEVRQLLPRLRDPNLTRVLLVTLAQATPVLEAARLQDDLIRAGITPFYWVFNQTWNGVPTSDPVLTSLANEEQPWIEKVVHTLARKTVYIPWKPVIPRGIAGLAGLL
ncbi:MAG TPA: arsenical pump-driving ATPase [Syntrophomonadaceae bacterium]|nr:arsenical pump-driving ATPase [Syntrophomonadaceae bacterium]